MLLNTLEIETSHRSGVLEIFKNKKNNNMNNLTQSQKEIIAKLTNEFETLNKSTESNLSSLLDINALLGELYADKKRRKEIEVSNIAYMRKLHQTANHYAYELHKFVIKANIGVWVKEYDDCCAINLGTLDHKYYQIQIMLNPQSQWTSFKSKIEGLHEYLNESKIEFGRYEYNNLESLMKSEAFINELKQLIIYIND